MQVVAPSLVIVTMGLLLASDNEGWRAVLYLAVLIAAVAWINVLHFRAGRPSGSATGPHS